MKFFKRINLSIVIFIFSFVFISHVTAEQKVLFQMSPDNIPFYKENKILTLWNPKGHPDIHKPGLKIFFFGKAENCLSDAQNGPVKIIKPNAEITQLTGISLDDTGKVFIPIPDKNLCFDTKKAKNEGSFIYVSENPVKGGIGIFTASGIDKDGIPYFFQTRDEAGVGGGVNKFEKSTAFTWKLEKEKIFPFEKRKSLKVLVKSSVESLPLIIKEEKLPIQVRQQIEIGFANKNCLKQKQEGKILCLNKYVFDFLVKRWGGKPLDEQRECLIFVDKGQGGLPHIACYSKPNGTKLLEKGSQLDMAASCGEGLQQTTFKDKNFCYTISWNQFLNSLKAIASNHLNKSVKQITEKNLQDLFGKDFDNPENWYITVISFQQELHDSYKYNNLYIGGNFKEIKIILE